MASRGRSNGIVHGSRHRWWRGRFRQGGPAAPISTRTLASALIATLSPGASVAFASAREMVVSPVQASARVAPPVQAGARVEPPIQAGALHISRVARPPRLDDFLDGVPPVADTAVTDFRQRQPGDGIPAGQETAAYLSYDDKNLYVVFVCREEPGKVRFRKARREDIKSDDQVLLYLDTFHDRQRAYVFAANPLGVQRDGIVTQGQGEDFRFDALWSSEGRLTPEGFVVRMAIPFQSLRFAKGEIQRWGIALGRIRYGNNEESYWPHITTRVEGFIQQLGSLEGIERISPRRNVQVIPYSTYAASRVLDSREPSFKTLELTRTGLDAKIGLRDALALDLTLNPDFSNVESDDPQVTVNKRFEVKLPEKRPFFLENAGFFETPVNLFHSRRIVEPGFGARLTGKLGHWAIGAVAADDRAPGEQVAPTDSLSGRRAGIGVFRVQRELFKESRIGLLATTRDWASSWSRVAGVDLRLKLNSNWVFSGQIVRSEDRQLSGARRSGQAYVAALDRAGRHFTYAGRYRDLSPDFGSQVGFVSRVDIREMEHTVGYLWRPNGRYLLSFGPSLFGTVNWDRRGRMQDWFYGAYFGMYFTGATSLSIQRYEWMELYQDLPFRKHSTDVTLSTGWLRWLGLSATYSRGTEVNFYPADSVAPFLADKRDASLTLSLRPVAPLLLEQTYFYSSLRTRRGRTPPADPAPANIYVNPVARWKLNYQATRALSLRAILDYNALVPNPALVEGDTTRRVGMDFLVTYLVNPSTALYVGYIDRFENLALDPTTPPSLRRTTSPATSTARQVFVKLSYLLRF